LIGYNQPKGLDKIEGWKWINGEEQLYINWNEGEPNDWNDVDETAAFMSFSMRGNLHCGGARALGVGLHLLLVAINFI
jgi:hypothetical protein